MMTTDYYCGLPTIQDLFNERRMTPHHPPTNEYTSLLLDNTEPLGGEEATVEPLGGPIQFDAGGCFPAEPPTIFGLADDVMGGKACDAYYYNSSYGGSSNSSSPYSTGSTSSGATYQQQLAVQARHSLSFFPLTPNSQSSLLCDTKQECDDSPMLISCAYPMVKPELKVEPVFPATPPQMTSSGGDSPTTMEEEEDGEDYQRIPLTRWNRAAWNNCLIDFLSHTESQERHRLGHSWVRAWFRGENFVRRSPIKVYHMSRTELWLADCIYGHQLQMWMCKQLGLPLPKVSQKHRKRPLKSPKMRRQTAENTIYEEADMVTTSCSSTERKRTSPRDQILLHIFCLDLLCHPYYNRVVQWKDKAKLVFTVLNSVQVARLWQQVKENETCDYENFARGIRYSRSRGYFLPLRKQQKKVYQLSRKAIDDYAKKTGRNPFSADQVGC